MRSSDSEDLTSIADELYALTPDRFTAERNSRAKSERAAGRRPLGDEIAGLTKPSASAWLANAMARSYPDEMDQLVALGSTLRDAQEAAPDRDRLRQLAAARRELIASIADLGSSIADHAGRTVSPSVRDELEQTLAAALADPGAADALRSGRLIRSLTTDGLEPVDLAGAVAGSAGHPADRSARSRTDAARPDGTEDLDMRRRRRDAETALAAAQAAVDAANTRARDAAEAADGAQHSVDAAGARRDELAGRVDELQRQLVQLTSELDDANDDVDAATRQAMATARRRSAADREVAAAEDEVARLHSRLDKL